MEQENELVRACHAAPRAAREECYRALYERHKDMIYNLCYRMTGSAPDALDAVQAAFAVVFRRIDEFRFDARFSTWLARIAVNCCMDLHRSERRRRSVPLSELDPTSALIERERERPVATLSRVETVRAVHEAIGRLSPKLREVVVLRYLEERSYEEVGRALRLSPGTVKSRLSRARTALFRELASLHGESSRESPTPTISR